jgi:hypothetical protein
MGIWAVEKIGGKMVYQCGYENDSHSSYNIYSKYLPAQIKKCRENQHG